MAQERSARAINRRGKKRESVTYSTDREDEVSKVFISYILLCLTSSGTISIHEERLQISGSRSKAKGVFKSLARFSTQVRVEESFKPLLAK